MSEAEEKLVNLEVHGEPVQARPGQMLIEVTDAAEVYVPRFCYHRKLSIAANCRMCLVDVEKAPKPLPACATPVAEGMKVFTRSKRALSAQKATMEFLLINHPLDCPICDQGGECELQDLAMGFGRGISRYTERKRVVKDKNLGSLVSTDMTRCIHCTRCVRFGEEIAGIPTLGTVGRGEDMEISTYIEQSIDHELSGNIIDLCPVGALNNKPYRFAARAWEMTAHPVVSPHDCAGSNMYAHVLRDRVRRVVPRDNDDINDAWLADRDRFSCHAIDAEDRVREPQIKRDGEWQTVGWQEALEHAASAIVDSTAGEGSALGVLAGPSATLEEYHLLRRLADGLGTRNIDHRLRRRDFTDQVNDAPWPWLGCDIADLATRDAVMLIGCDIRGEAPILAHQIRKAALAGAEFSALNPVRYDYHFPVAAYSVAPPAAFAKGLAALVAAAHTAHGGDLPAHVEALIGDSDPDDEQRALVKTLADKSDALILLGQISGRHPEFATLRVLASALAELCGAQLGCISEGANAAGAALAGVLPHRDPGAKASESEGLDAAAMLNSPRRAYLLLGFEPDADTADGQTAERALQSADHVIAATPFASERLRECADVLLPVGTFAETPGTFINAMGTWQSFEAAMQPVGEARPAWRVLRVLGNVLELEGFDYETCGDVLHEARSLIGDVAPDNQHAGEYRPPVREDEPSWDGIMLGIYDVDALVRRSEPLQQTALATPGEPQRSEARSA
mgnify:CR=1 FL=1